MRALSLALMVLFAVLAGCSDAEPAAEPEGPQVREVETDDSSGAISGVVVDETIRPLEGATVRLVATGEEVTTAEDGTFVFEDLEAGFYALEAQADRYLPVQSTVELKAGAVAKPRMVLPRDTSPVPYHQSHQFSGHMVLSDFYGVYILTATLGDNDVCRCIFNFTDAPGPKTLVLEALWESSTPRAIEHEMYWDVWSPGSELYGQWSASPTLWHLDGSQFGEDTQWSVQVSSAEQPDVEQPVDGFLTFFYVDPAPSGWSLVGGDA